MIAGDRMEERGSKREHNFIQGQSGAEMFILFYFIDLTRQDDQDEISFQEWAKSE